jgi:hypothetical protein
VLLLAAATLCPLRQTTPPHQAAKSVSRRLLLWLLIMFVAILQNLYTLRSSNDCKPMFLCCRQHRKHAPGKGWLLVWTGTAGSNAAQPFPSATGPDAPKPEKATWVVDTSPASSMSSTSSAGSGNASSSSPPTAGVRSNSSSSGATLMFPGGPSCTLMAWPSRGGGSWSGAVFAAPQVRCWTVGQGCCSCTMS